MTRFWTGGYGEAMDGTASGIGLLAGDEGREPATLAYRGAVARAESPSWLAAHPTVDVVYAALESSGAVQAFVRTGESALSPLGAPVEVGDGVCHLAVSPDGTFLVASCYGDGRVVRVALQGDGALGATTIGPAAADPHAKDAAEVADAILLGARSLDLRDLDAVSDAQARAAAGAEAAEAAGARGSHAHAAAFLPDGRIATTDLGFDIVRIWRQGQTGLIADHEVMLPRGVGPRHMVVHPSGHLHVVTEYSCEVFTLAAGRDGRWAIASVTLTAPIAQFGFDFPAELVRSRDGAFLYTALRGSNTIAVLRVRGGGESLESVALAESGVDWPRHHLIHDGTLLVSGQRSDTVSVLDLDDRTGAPGRVRHLAPVPAPTHLLPVR